MRVLVVCPVHHPRDARVSEREIAALTDAGHAVTQVGPFTAFGASPLPGVRAVDIPRSHGRRRTASLRAARRAVRSLAPDHDVVLLHSPEALATIAGLRHPCVVWDVHEDTAAAIGMKPWLPAALAAPTAWGVRRVEHWAERRVHLLLAEEAYADRFDRAHPVVPNAVSVPEGVPPTSRGRAVYVGSLSRARGADDLIEVGRLLAEEGAVTLELIGGAGPEVADDLRRAADRGWMTWHGYVENSRALTMLEGATAGLSLLHDKPNYRHSMPTKLLEYLAHGIPFVSTPLPLAVELAERSGGGVIVPFGDSRAVRDAIMRLDGDDDMRLSMAESGREWVRTHMNWAIEGPAFVRQLQLWSPP